MRQRVTLGRVGFGNVGCVAAEKDRFDDIADLFDVFFLEEDREGFTDDKGEGGFAFGCVGFGLVLARVGSEEGRNVFQVVFVVLAGVGVLVGVFERLPFGEEDIDLMAGEEFHGVGRTLDDLEVAGDVDEVAAGLDAVDYVDGFAFAFEGDLAGFAGVAHSSGVAAGGFAHDDVAVVGCLGGVDL